jgi:hypothetical protein
MALLAMAKLILPRGLLSRGKNKATLARGPKGVRLRGVACFLPHRACLGYRLGVGCACMSR